MTDHVRIVIIFYLVVSLGIQLLPVKLVTATEADFIITVEPLVNSVEQGKNISFRVNVIQNGDFSEPVYLSVSNLPTGASATFDYIGGEPPFLSILLISTQLTISSATPVGSHTITITGTSGNIIRSTTFTLIVEPAKFYNLPRTEDNYVFGEGTAQQSWLEASIYRVLVPPDLLPSSGNTDGTFYPEDEITFRLAGNTDGKYDRVYISSQAFESKTVQVSGVINSMEDHKFIIKNNIEPDLYSASFLMMPSIVRIRLVMGLIWTTGHEHYLPAGGYMQGKTTKIYLREQTTQRTYMFDVDPGSQTSASYEIEQGVYTISWATYEYNPEYAVPPTVTVGFEAGGSYYLVGFYNENEDGETYVRWTYAPPTNPADIPVDPSVFVYTPELMTELTFCVVPYNPQFATLYYTWFKWEHPNGYTPDINFDLPQSILVRYDGNRYDPDNENRLSLNQRATVDMIDIGAPPPEFEVLGLTEEDIGMRTSAVEIPRKMRERTQQTYDNYRKTFGLNIVTLVGYPEHVAYTVDGAKVYVNDVEYTGPYIFLTLDAGVYHIRFEVPSSYYWLYAPPEITIALGTFPNEVSEAKALSIYAWYKETEFISSDIRDAVDNGRTADENIRYSFLYHIGDDLRNYGIRYRPIYGDGYGAATDVLSDPMMSFYRKDTAGNILYYEASDIEFADNGMPKTATGLLEPIYPVGTSIINIQTIEQDYYPYNLRDNGGTYAQPLKINWELEDFEQERLVLPNADDKIYIEWSDGTGCNSFRLYTLQIGTLVHLMVDYDYTGSIIFDSNNRYKKFSTFLDIGSYNEDEHYLTPEKRVEMGVGNRKAYEWLFAGSVSTTINLYREGVAGTQFNTLSTAFSWELMGVSQPMAVTSMKLNDSVREQIYNSENGLILTSGVTEIDNLVLYDSSWVADTTTQVSARFIPLLTAKQLSENMENEEFAEAISTLNPTFGGLGTIDNYMFNTLIEDALVENEPEQVINYLWPVCSGNGILRRYFSNLFYLVVTAYRYDENGIVEDFVEVQFQPDSELKIYANLTGDGLVSNLNADPQRVGTEIFKVTAYAPPQAGGIKSIVVKDNHGNTLYRRDYNQLWQSISNFISKVAGVTWATNNEPVLVEGGDPVTDYKIVRPSYDTEVTVEITNLWGATVEFGPYHVDAFVPQLLPNALLAIIIIFVAIIITVVVNTMLDNLRGRRAVGTVTSRPSGEPAEMGEEEEEEA